MKSKKKSKKIYIILLVVCLLVMAGLVAGLFGYAHYIFIAYYSFSYVLLRLIGKHDRIRTAPDDRQNHEDEGLQRNDQDVENGPRHIQDPL